MYLPSPPSDELMVPYATSACGRTVWMIILALGLALTTHMLLSGSCSEVGYLVLAYEGVSIVVGVLSLVVECQIANASTYGTIMGERTEVEGGGFVGSDESGEARGE